MNNKVDVSVIYVNFNSSEFLSTSLASFVTESKNFLYEVIVIDNSECESEEKKLYSLKEKYGFSLVFSKNVGFGIANNIGAKMANGEYIYFLNCDTKLISNAGYELLSFFRNNKDCGVAGSNLLSDNLKPNFSYQKYEKNLINDMRHSSLLHLLKRNEKFNSSGQPLEIKGFVSGASMMIKKDLFLECGGFPEEIFMYAEDSYICYKFSHSFGLKIYNVPSSKVIHFEGKSFSISNKRIEESCNGNYMYYKLLFGEEIAKSYLLRSMKIYKRNSIIARLLFQKGKVSKFSLFYKTYSQKLKSLSE